MALIGQIKNSYLDAYSLVPAMKMHMKIKQYDDAMRSNNEFCPLGPKNLKWKKASF